MPGRLPILVVGILTLLAIALGVAGAAPMLVYAQTPPAACPESPAVYEGTDAIVNELRALRSDVRTSCVATAERLDLAHADAVAAQAQLEQLDGDDDGAKLDAILAELADDSTEPARAVTLAGFEGDGVEVVNDWTQTPWFLAGLIIACFGGSVLLRQVLPR